MRTTYFDKKSSLLCSAAAAFIGLVFSTTGASASQVNLLNYTKGDGITDDQSGIIRAFAAAGPSGTVIAPAGHTWAHSGVLSAPPGLQIIGGDRSSVFKATTSNGALILTGSKSLVANMTISYANVSLGSSSSNGSYNDSDIVAQSASNIQLQNLKLGSAPGNSVSALQSSGSLNNSVLESTAQNALLVVDCTSLTAASNQITTGGCAVNVSNGTKGSQSIVVENNTFNLTGGSSPGVSISGVNGMWVTNNLFNNNGSVPYDIWAAPLPANQNQGYGPISNLYILGNTMSLGSKLLPQASSVDGVVAQAIGPVTPPNQNPVYYAGILVLPPGMELPSPPSAYLNLVNGLTIQGNVIANAITGINASFASNIVIQSNNLLNIQELDTTVPAFGMQFAYCGNLTIGGPSTAKGKVAASAANIFQNITGSAIQVMQNFSGTYDPSNPVGAVAIQGNSFNNCYCLSGNLTRDPDPVWANSVVKVLAGAYPSVNITNNAYTGPVNKNLQYFIDCLQPKAQGSGNTAPYWLPSLFE
jgi:hypothetical protein